MKIGRIPPLKTSCRNPHMHSTLLVFRPLQTESCWDFSSLERHKPTQQLSQLPDFVTTQTISYAISEFVLPVLFIRLITPPDCFHNWTSP